MMITLRAQLLKLIIEVMPFAKMKPSLPLKMGIKHPNILGEPEVTPKNPCPKVSLKFSTWSN
jgi:hypothetical protein